MHSGEMEGSEMKGLLLEEVIRATSGRVLLKGQDRFRGVSIDSRRIGESELFIALRGANFDGHDFLDEALKKGAGAVVNYPPNIPVQGKTIIHVNNTLKALQDLAHFRRMERDVKVIGITGTNGKTSTKEMVCEILRNYTEVLCSTGNLNNQIGLPLNLLELEDEGICILEMGASRQGDIKELCDIAHPDLGIITNVGPAHLEGFGSLEVVRDTKLELADAVNTLVMNADDEVLAGSLEKLKEKKGLKVLTYGVRNEAPVMAKDIRVADIGARNGISTRFTLTIRDAGETEIALQVHGLFNIYNALASAAVANLLEVPIEVIRSGLEGFRGVPMRMEIKKMQGVVVISDMYNANPSSMEEAVKELVRIRKKRAIAVLGDMLELGSYAETAHRKLGAWLAEIPVDVFIGVGELMGKAADEFKTYANGSRKVLNAGNSEAARNMLYDIINEGDTVLIKGSRGMQMERIMEEN